MRISNGARIVLQLLLCIFLFGEVSTANAKTKLLPKPRPHFVDMTNPVNCLARAVYVEARGESDYGQLMVAYVIRYRTLLDLPGTGGRTLCKAIYAKAQVNGVSGKTWAPDDMFAWGVALAMADEVLSGRFDPVGELHYATFYLRPEKSSLRGKCWFENKLRPIAWVGNHLFYRQPLSYEQPRPSYDCYTNIAKR